MVQKIWCVSIIVAPYDSKSSTFSWGMPAWERPKGESYFTTLEAANEYYEKTRYFDAEIGLYECSVKEFKVCPDLERPLRHKNMFEILDNVDKTKLL